MRIACISSPTCFDVKSQLKSLCDDDSPTSIKLSGSNRTVTTEELSTCPSSIKGYHAFSNASSFSFESTETSQAQHQTTNDLVGILVTEPRTSLRNPAKRRRCKRVRFGHGGGASTPYNINQKYSYNHNSTDYLPQEEVHVISTHQPASEMTADEISQVHYRLEDYEFFRGTARYIATEVRDRACPNHHEQEEAATSPTTTKPSTFSTTSHSYDEVVTQTYQMCAMHSEESPLNIINNNNNTQHRHHHHHRLTTHTDIPHCSLHEENKSNEQWLNDDPDLHRMSSITSLTPRLFEALTHWIRAGHSRRGLEKFSVPYLVRARPQSRQAARNAVLVAHDMLKDFDKRMNKGNTNRKEDATNTKKTKNEGKQCRHHNVWRWWRGVSSPSSIQSLGKSIHRNEKEREDRNKIALLERMGIPQALISPSLSNEEVIRIVSIEYTRTAKVFALAMGHADAAALGIYLNISHNS